MTYSSETICALSGADRLNLKRWYRSGLIKGAGAAQEWSDAQLQDVLHMTQMTREGATIREIKIAQDAQLPVRTGGWAARRGDMLWQLEFGSDHSLTRLLRKLASNFTGDDLVLKLLRPLNHWLRDDTRSGADRRRARFHLLILDHADSVNRSSQRFAAVPLLLESLSERDKTEVWLESIRLSSQGFRVELRPLAAAVDVGAHDHEHHLLWCGAGITEVMHQDFLTRLAEGQHVMLCGPDSRLHHHYPQLPAVA
ncbi:hypothetical protein BBB56_13420 [Candidatus Pantoea deserta]|uniref:Transcriptional regulator MlrA-like C-terminal domain-containing protein n=1 Tax=Candidatus Pantoea deserta TaxID=1869313 RepID=A0A3N4PJR1_9GAMM|nr:hypothetical protein [Pantoea deserta]RPD99843.1 hypothetical protein BBB56_13420 [Pantoea deserta]